MNLHWLDITTLAIYMSSLIAMGFYFSKRNKSTEEYFVGGRSYNGFIIGLSMIGTSISSVTFLAFPADAFKTAYLRFLPNFTLPIAILLAAYMFLPFFRRTKIISAYEYLEERFSPSIRVYGAITFIIGQLVRIALILFLVSLLMHEITGLGAIESILLAGVFVSIYTIIGGIDAVIWTDVLQTIILVLGGIVILAIIVFALPGGFSQIFEIANADNKFAIAELTNGRLNPVTWAFSLSDKTGLMMLFVGLTVWLQEYGTNQNVVQRYAAAKSIKEARKGLFTIGTLNIPIWGFYMFLGTALYAYFQVFPTVEAQEMLTGAKKAEQIMPFFIINYMPPGVAGIVISAALAAAMSSLDSSINAISTVTVNDIYRRHWVKDADDKHYLRVAWIAASIASVFMIIGAIILAETETKTLQDAATILSSVVMGGVFGMYLLGFVSQKANSSAVWIGILITFIFSLWNVLSKQGLLPESLSVPFDLYYTGLIGHIILFATAFVASVLFFGNKEKKDLTNLTVWTQDGKPIE
ncbi:MAG: sodium:solute symporter [Ignavibacteriales bacterium]|nr:sodium:solute symporter [Ignavibacteriales bacterium]